MSRSISKGKIVAIALGAVAVVLAGVIVSSMVVAIYALNGGSVNLPKDYHSKDASKELGTSENPYTILEIVPDTDSATVGYLIKGSEPISLERIGVNSQASNIYKEGFKSSSTVSEEPLDTYALRQETYRIDDQGYESGIFTSLLDEYEPGMPLDNDHMAFSQFGYFEKVDNGGAYNYDINKECFVPAERDSSGIYNGNFNWIGVGSFQYKGIGKGNYSRELERYEVDEQGAIVVDEDGNPIENVRTYSCVYDFEGRVMLGAVGNKAYNYGYTTFGDFEWVPNDNYNGEDVTIENQTEVSYVDASGNVRKRTIEQAVTGDKFYMTRTENYFYKYKSSSIVCNDELIKAIANKTAIDYKTQVVTATPNQLKDKSSGNQDRVNELIETADMIIIHDEVTGYNIAKEMKPSQVQGNAPTFTSDSNGSGDLSDDLVDKLIARGANGISKDSITGNITKKPAAIVFDESAIKNANNCTCLTRLYNVYNNLGAKLAYNLSGNNYDTKVNTYKSRDLGTDVDNALGKSQFVYNYKGDNSSWISEFASDSKVQKNALTEPAFDNVGLSDEVTTMSVAKMFAAVNKESQGCNQPEKLRILEVEPNEEFYYNSSDRDSWLKHYLDIFPWFIGTTQSVGNGDGEDDDIRIIAMPTYEFIGKNEDLNESYDAIFIGDKEKDLTNGSKGYNDSNYRSLDYVGIGDKVSTARNGEDSEVRYSGNDITKKKYYQLVEFAKQGPIIIDDKMCKSSNGQYVVDENIVDKSSFVYYIADKNKDDKYGNAVNSNNNSANSVKKDVTQNELSFTFMPNVGINDKGYPIEYANTNGTMTDNSVQKEGINNTLKFRFELNGKENTLYGLKLYIDDNGNGVYEGCIDHKIEISDNGGDMSKVKSEESSNLVIYDETINMVVSSGNMVNGHKYSVTSILPESTVGLISWKLELYAIDEKNPFSYPSTRCSAENDTRIVPKEKIKLNVLQMYTSPKMNEQDPTMSLSTDKDFIFGNRVAEEFTELVSGMPDFDVKVDYLNPNDWRRNKDLYDSDKWGKYLLANYNMLILGFKDSARFTNDPVFRAGFEKFRQSGRPIIISHDMVSNDNGIDSDVRYYIRNLTGQMRKYYNVSDVVNNNSNDYFFDRYWTRGNTEPVPFNYSKYKGGEGTKWAVSRVDNSNRVMLEYSDYKDLHDRFVKKPTYFFKWGILGGGYKDTRYVKPVNKGKITKYPFDLSKLETTYGLYTRQTHAQNYQLDLEYDDEGDVIVWYNLVDGDYGNFYDGRYHDCRNNYYIYTKGNITYTGIGHSEGNWSENAITTNENKLFINTMIAAYRSSAVDPYLSIANEDTVQESSDTYTIYMNDFDNYNAAGILDSNVRFSIKDDTTNADIRKRYWVEVIKDGQPFKAFPAEKNYTYGYGDEESEYGLPIRYSEVYSKDEVKYEIYLYSNYEGKTTDYNIPDDIKTVTIKKIPMFGLY